MFKKKNADDRYTAKTGKNAYGQLFLTAGLALGIFSILCVIRNLFPFGSGSVLMIDLHSQYTPLLYRFYDVVTGQKNLFLDFGVSGGANLYTDTINEVINPFNYLLFFFGREKIYLAINVLLGAYVIAAAVSVNFFLLRLWPKQRNWNVIFSLLYGFSGFAAYQFQIIKWMYFPVLFPLFVLALLRLLQKKKGGLYAVLLAYQLMLNLQLGAMSLLAVLFGSGLYFFFCMEKEEKGQAFLEKRRTMCRLAWDTVLGVAASAVVLLPNLLYLLSSARGSENGSYFAVMKQHGLDDLFERLFLTVHPVLLGIFVCLAGRYFLKRKKVGGLWKNMPSEGKFLFALNLLLFFTVLAQPSNLLWHLGSYMCFPVRYAYIVLLAGISLIKWLLLQLEKEREQEQQKSILRAGQLGTIFISAALCAAAVYLTLRHEAEITQAFSSLAISRVCPEQTTLVCLILGILTAAAILAMFTGKRKRLVQTIVTAATSLSLFFCILLPQDYEVRLMNEAAYEEMNEIYEQQDEKTGKFVRVPDDEDLPLNAALITGDDSLTGYFPAGSQMVYASGMEQLGYLTPWVSTRSWGGTRLSDTLLGLVKEEGAAAYQNGLLLQENAEVIKENCQKEAAEGPLSLQAYLGRAVTGSDVLKCVEASEVYRKETDSLLIQIQAQQALYLDAGRPASEITVLVDGEKIALPEKASAEGPHRLLYLGTYEEQEIQIQVLDRNQSMLPADTMELGFLDLNQWDRSKKQLLSAEDVVIQRRNGTMEVSVQDGKSGQTVFLPVAAINGWQCSADGERVEITPIFGGFMGITLTKAAEKLVFTFCPPGFKAGLIVSAAAFVLLAAGSLLDRRVLRKREDGKAKWFAPVVSCSAVCYQAVWIGGWILIYVVPNIGLICYMAYRVLFG